MPGCFWRAFCQKIPKPFFLYLSLDKNILLFFTINSKLLKVPQIMLLFCLTPQTPHPTRSEPLFWIFLRFSQLENCKSKLWSEYLRFMVNGWFFLYFPLNPFYFWCNFTIFKLYIFFTAKTLNLSWTSSMQNMVNFKQSKWFKIIVH